MTTGHPSRLMMITIHYRVHGWPEVTRRDVRMEPCRGFIKEKTSTYLAGEGGREICPSTWARFMLSSPSSPLKSEFLGRCLRETWWTGFFELFILHFGTRNITSNSPRSVVYSCISHAIFSLHFVFTLTTVTPLGKDAIMRIKFVNHYH